jgi:hypothetical protein
MKIKIFGLTKVFYLEVKRLCNLYKYFVSLRHRNEGLCYIKVVLYLLAFVCF